MRLNIVTGKNNPILRNPNKPIKRITPELEKFIGEMFRTMKEVDGIGLAAPQIGKNIQLFIVDELAFNPKRSKWEFKKIPAPDVSRGFVCINPEISSFPRVKNTMTEGCLSLPGREGLLTRSKRITIKAQDEEGRVFKLQAKGLLARVLQHEYDHIQRVLICDKWERERKIQNEKRKTTTKNLKLKNVVFFGDSEYSKIVLDILKNTPYEPEIIITKNSTTYNLQATTYELGITAAYGAIIPQNIIEKFKHGILNIHPSLLPKYRGSSPLQQTIINGDKTAGVSIIQLTSKMDAGAILAQKEFPLDKPYTSRELGTILFEIGGELLKTILSSYIKGLSVPTLQDERAASYTSLIKKEDALINWSEDAERIERKIRAYQPWPICYTFFEHHGKTIRIQLLKASTIKETLPQTVYGTIIKRGNDMIIQCGKDSLLIQRLRPEGKREMSGEEFLRGYQTAAFFSQTKEA